LLEQWRYEKEVRRFRTLIHWLFSEDAEKGVLCSLLLSPRKTSDLCEDLLPEAFYLRAHQIVYGVIRENIQTLSVGDGSYVNDARATVVYPQNSVGPIKLDAQIKTGPIEFVYLKHALKNRNLLEQMGGPEYLSELYSFVPTAANAAYYINTVLEKYELRWSI
jgi:replicative DNA helicase